MTRLAIPLLALLTLMSAVSKDILAQTPSVSSVSTLSGCGSDFFSDSGTPATCYSGVVTGCPNADDLQFTFSYDAPASPKGVIVFFFRRFREVRVGVPRRRAELRSGLFQ